MKYDDFQDKIVNNVAQLKSYISGGLKSYMRSRDDPGRWWLPSTMAGSTRLSWPTPGSTRISRMGSWSRNTDPLQMDDLIIESGRRKSFWKSLNLTWEGLGHGGVMGLDDWERVLNSQEVESADNKPGEVKDIGAGSTGEGTAHYPGGRAAGTAHGPSENTTDVLAHGEGGVDHGVHGDGTAREVPHSHGGGAVVDAEALERHDIMEPKTKKIRIETDNLEEHHTCDGQGEEAGRYQRDGGGPVGDALGQGGEGDGQRDAQARVMVPRMGKVRLAKRDSRRQLSLSNFLSTEGNLEMKRGRSVIAGSKGVKQIVSEFENLSSKK